MLTSASCILVLALLAQVDGPAAFGESEIRHAMAGVGDAEASWTIRVETTGRGTPGSFEVRRNGGNIVVAGADEAGAMYGALELAERVRQRGARALEDALPSGIPRFRDRGLNIFLTLPWDYAKCATDYDPAALTDGARWWFHDEDYWRTLFDLMARARLNWLDLHGLWDISVTDAPNLYAYFVTSATYPAVGVDLAIREANLRRLNWIVDRARDRGIRVSLMSYEAKFSIPHHRKPPVEASEAAIATYTREAVEAMIRGVPGLGAIGFRIGESGKSARFFQCYVDAVERSGRDIPLITRSWITTKSQVVPLARRARDFTVEIKYNGEQWGPPWPIAGGRAAGWYSYSFEDYLSDSGPGAAVALRRGRPAGSGGERWPDQPYGIVWQVRANGTHRVFPFYEPGLVRRSIEAMALGTASGYTVEPLHAYYPPSPRYLHVDPAEISCRWTHERDFPFLMLWGRLGYDPSTPDEDLDAAVAVRFGEAAPDLLRVWKTASRIVPWIFTAWSLGPDHRNHAPELEWGGDSESVASAEPFDSHVFMSLRQRLALAATGGSDGRLTPLDVAAMLDDATREIDAFVPPPEQGAPAGERTARREIVRTVRMLGRLATYWSGRFRAAWAEAAAEATDDEGERRSRLRRAALEMDRAEAAFADLALGEDGKSFRPFTERLRMRTNTFHWKDELPKVRSEAARVRRLGDGAAEPAAVPAARPLPPEAAGVRVECTGDRVRLLVRAPGAARAWSLEKPLPSATFFHRRPMVRQGEDLVAEFSRLPAGHALAADVEIGGVVHRLPDGRRATPYLVVPARAAPTPLYYNSSEALRFLKSGTLKPEKHGLLLIATRGWSFHRGFDVSVQRKILDAVAQGMTLLVLQQDYMSGRYPLSWLPVPPGVENHAEATFDPAGAFGLLPVTSGGILAQRFTPAPGWTIHGNGGVAETAHGRGRIVMVQARLMQRMHVPAAARNLVTLLALQGRERPVVVIDHGTEGAHYVSSAFTDLMSAHDIPFMTLGEVIAEEQGTDSAEPVPGPPVPDRLLSGKPADAVNAALLAEVRGRAAAPLPEDAGAFRAGQERARREVLRCLGLDPLPERTPLSARTTGVLERDGYRIEKIVFESRPGFPVTAHLYIPSGAEGRRLPVIVNPHGHWRWKKDQPVVQARLIRQALRGYLALVVDSPGFSFEGDARVERRGAGAHDDYRLILGSTNATSIYVWDLMRALDLLETRPEADMTRVGITGASGGGLATVWAFAADPRFTAAVPVCYATSLAVNPRNGCLCNHVPGALRAGDRADVLAVRAPAPVLVIGARNDPEFPPEGTERTGRRMEALWGLLGAGDRALWRIFESGHDYNDAMQAAALDFFDRFLKGQAPGAQPDLPAVATDPPASPSRLVLPDEPRGTVTMRGVATARLHSARGREPLANLNDLPRGGRPLPLAVVVPAAGPGEVAGVTLDAGEGILIPGLLHEAAGAKRGGVVVLSEHGRMAAAAAVGAARLAAAGFDVLAIDPRGAGELAGIDLRLLSYLGRSASALMAVDAVNAAVTLRERSRSRDGEAVTGSSHQAPPYPVAIVGIGPAASLAALMAAEADASVARVVGIEALRSWIDAFRDDVSLLAIQPSADRARPLEDLRDALGARGVWRFIDEPDLADVPAFVETALGGPGR